MSAFFIDLWRTDYYGSTDLLISAGDRAQPVNSSFRSTGFTGTSTKSVIINKQYGKYM